MLHAFFTDAGPISRVIVAILVAIFAHGCVRLVRYVSSSAAPRLVSTLSRKVQSVVSLIFSILIFTLYFGAAGLILNEFGVSITAYLASASVLALAVGFGSQGIVQDVVTGLTLIFSDLCDVGDMVEISGQSGIVRSIGMRFIVIENSLGAQVFIPNRSITNVINYARGYVRCLVDVNLSEDPQTAETMLQGIESLVAVVVEQFPGIFVLPPSIEGRLRTAAGYEFVRIKFRIWPNRGGPIETNFKQGLLQQLKKIDNNYQDWMLAIHYEVEKKIAK